MSIPLIACELDQGCLREGGFRDVGTGVFKCHSNATLRGFMESCFGNRIIRCQKNGFSCSVEIFKNVNVTMEELLRDRFLIVGVVSLLRLPWLWERCVYFPLQLDVW